MSDRFADRLRALASRIQQQDPELAAEMEAVRAEAGTTEGISLEGIDSGSAASFDLETIVLRKERPVLAVKEGTAQLEFSRDDAKVWQERLTQAQAVVAPRIRAVGRVELKNNPRFEWVGTAWLLADDIIVTNRHVAREFAQANGTKFDFRSGPAGKMQASVDFLREVSSTATMTMGVKRVLHIEDNTGPDIAFLQLVGSATGIGTPIALASGSSEAKRFVATIGYPARDSRIPEQALMERIFGDVYNVKRFAPGQLIGNNGTSVLHDCSTLGGNSGSVVIDLETGSAVGLHFAGRFLEANYAVNAAAIAERLHAVKSGKVTRSGSAPPARIEGSITQASQTDSGTRGRSGTEASLTYTIPIEITVRVGTPITGTGDDGGGDGGGWSAPRGARPISSTRPPDDDQDALGFELPNDPSSYDDRDGYDPEFLGEDANVPLPEMDESQEGDLLVYQKDGRDEYVLDYRHFSVVMSESRRLCFFSAANIDGKRSKPIKRVGWRFDSRIPREMQILKECYGPEPKFSRGHMTRREDPVWGAQGEAAQGNSDSMHATNVVPQMQPFNAGIWLGLENYALRNAREDEMRISVFTGPFYTTKDPERDGVNIPLTFWKVLAFIHAETGRLCATGYSMSQESFLSEEEFVFGQHEASQLPITTIEKRANISFGGLAEVDPLAGGEEGLSSVLTSLDQIRFT